MTGPELRAARLRLGLSQSALGLILCGTQDPLIAQQMMSRYERGVKPVPAPMAVAVAYILKCGLPVPSLDLE